MWTDADCTKNMIAFSHYDTYIRNNISGMPAVSQASELGITLIS